MYFWKHVHRLDKPVSGIVVFGKTGKALTRLNASIRSKHVKKIYIAGVEGIPAAKNGVVENFVIHDEHCAQIVASNHPEGKLARLSYRIIETFENEALLEIELETGRYHQIRVQLAGLGCPIRGDRRYGSRRQFSPESIALHHARLLIPHPVTNEILTFEAPLPSNFFNIYLK